MNRRNFILKGLAGIAGITAVAGGGIFCYVNRPEFGRLPADARLEKILKSPHYINNRFECLTPVKVMAEDVQDS